MDQQSIDAELDKMLSNAENDMDKAFATRLKTILNQIGSMYQKYSNGDGELSWTDLNKYNRYQQEMAMIAAEMTSQYQQLLTSMQNLLENVYLQDFMKSSYLYELASQTALGVTIPPLSVIQAAVKNPIPKLTLPSLMETHRNEIVRKIDLEISQSLMVGEDYAKMANRIEKAVGFSQAKARRVARTEAGRVRSQARIDSAEQAAKHADMVKVWLSTLDERTRLSHRELDLKEADDEGLFHYHGLEAKGPHLWMRPEMDINCRCTIIMKVNGRLPDTRRARDYQDAAYQQKLADRMDDLMADGMTQKQAEKQAKKEISAPSVTIPFKPYDEWLTGKKKPTPKQDGPTIKMPDGSERAAVVDNSSGIPIIQPVDLDTNIQTLSVDDVKEYINQVPKEHQGVIKEIHLLDMFDQEGSTVFNNAAGGYDLETKNIELYRNDWLNKDTRDKTLAGIVRHETAHALQETLGDQFLKDWKKAAKKDAAHITDYAKTDIYEDIAETIMYHWSPDSIERRTVQFFFPERYAVLQKYGVKEGHNPGDDVVEVVKNISDSIAKTDMKEKLGESNYNKFADHLNGLKNERLRKLYEKYGDKIDFVSDTYSCATGKVAHLRQDAFDGNRIEYPLETVYHEIAHTMDSLGLRAITGDKLFKTGKKIKRRFGRKSYEIDEAFDNISAHPKYKLKETIRRDLWEYVNGDLPMFEDIGRKPRNKDKKAAWYEKESHIYRTSKKNFEEFDRKIKEKYDGQPKAVANLSDIYGATSYGLGLSATPFGAGHGKAYFKDAGLAEAEFFAELTDSIAANEESYNLLSEIFPNAIKVWENIVDDMLKAGE